MPDRIEVVSLHIYPVKSLRGLTLEEARLTVGGLESDRSWVVVDADNRRLSARKNPRLATIGVSLAGEGLILTCQNQPNIQVPAAGGTLCNVRLGDSAYDQHAHRTSPAVTAWLTAALGFECSLVRLSPEGKSALAAFPIHLISTSSMSYLNMQLDVPISPERFRPNIIVEGAAPFAEDHWNEVDIGGVRMRLLELTDRCIVPNIDPLTGATAAEPLRTLAKLRRVGKAVRFGIYLVPLSAGFLCRGAQVTL